MAYGQLNEDDPEYQYNSTNQIGSQLKTPDQNSPDYNGQTQPQTPASTAPIWDKNARNSVRDAWQSGSGSLADFIASSPYSKYLSASDDILTLQATADDKYGYMGPEQIDAVLDFGAGGQNKHVWTGVGPGSGGSGPGGSLTEADRQPGAASGGGGIAGGPSVGGLQSPQAQKLFDLLMSRAQQSENVDKNDPIIKGQTDAFNAQGQQARRDFLSAQAEKAGPYGNQLSEERRSAEELGKSTGAFQAQAMQNELGARRQEIEQALSGAAGFLTSQQQMQLQEELQKITLQQQESQFGRSLGQNAFQFDVNRYDNIFG